MTPDWEATAKGLGYKNEKGMWTALYTEQKASLSQLAIAFRTSVNSVRGRLNVCEILLRKAGGANNQKFQMDDAIAKRCEDEGTASVARNLNLSYTSMHKALKKFRTISALAAPVSAEQSPRSSPDSEHPVPASSSESLPPEPEGPDSSQTAKGGKLGS